jgi:hypothetical protein
MTEKSGKYDRDTKNGANCPVLKVEKMIELFLSAKANSQTHDSNSSVEVVVCSVDNKESKDASAIHETKDCDKSVDNSKDDQVEASVGFAGRDGNQSHNTAKDVDDVVHCINLEEAQNWVIDEAE